MEWTDTGQIDAQSIEFQGENLIWQQFWVNETLSTQDIAL